MKNSYMNKIAIVLCLAGGLIGSVQAKKCFIGDLNKARLLCSLYGDAKISTAAWQFGSFGPDWLGAWEAKEILKNSLKKRSGFIDYLKGRVMKVCLSGNTLDTSGYNRDNGEGAAEKVIANHRLHEFFDPGSIFPVLGRTLGDEIATEKDLDLHSKNLSIGTKCIEENDGKNYDKYNLRDARLRYVLNDENNVKAYRDAYQKCLKKDFKNGEKKCKHFISAFYKKERAREMAARRVLDWTSGLPGFDWMYTPAKDVNPKVFEEEI